MFAVVSRTFTVITITLLAGASLAHAQTAADLEATVTLQTDLGTDSDTRPLNQVRGRLQDIRENARDARDQLMVETRLEMQNAASERLQIARDRVLDTTNRAAGSNRGLAHQYSGLIRERFGIAIHQFDALVGRIESRMEKMSEGGADVSKAAMLLMTARAQIDEAESSINNIQTFIQSIPEGAAPAEVRSHLRILVTHAQQNIRDAHAALVNVVRTLAAAHKPASDTSEGAATTTQE